MEFAAVTIKESPGLCRCCLSEGCYKDLGSEYTWMNETEIYADMLLDCFDIGITQHSDGPNGAKRLICEVCITRLRDACNFKKQVQHSEKKFIDMLGRGEFKTIDKQTVLVPMFTESQMKAEAIEEVTLTEDFEDSHIEYLDDVEYTPEDDEPIKKEPVPAPSTSGTGAKRGRPRKERPPNDVPEKKPKLKHKTAKLPKGGNEPVPVKLEELGDRKPILSAFKYNSFQKRNATIILQNCTAIPFKWQRQFYFCFYCNKQFELFDELRKHSTAHKNPNVKSVVSILRGDDKVKIDINSLKCKLCGFVPKTVDALVGHLSVSHNMIFHKVGYGVIPYKHLKDTFGCGTCDECFASFVKCNQHMNTHFGEYVCDICGHSYLSADRLRVHAKGHVSTVKCGQCSETFSSFSLRDTHKFNVHGKWKTKCQYCAQKFSCYLKRKVHLKTVHDIGSLHPCPVCGKEFSVASRMDTHLKEVHYKETKYFCGVCDKGFYQNWQLIKHMEKHNEKETTNT